MGSDVWRPRSYSWFCHLRDMWPRTSSWAVRPQFIHLLKWVWWCPCARGRHKEHLRQTYVKHHHHRLFGMLVLSSGNGITCPLYRHSNWGSGRSRAMSKVTVSPKLRTLGSPLYTSQSHFPTWNLPKLFIILVILLDPLLPPNSKGKKQPMLDSEEKPELDLSGGNLIHPDSTTCSEPERLKLYSAPSRRGKP